MADTLKACCQNHERIRHFEFRALVDRSDRVVELGAQQSPTRASSGPAPHDQSTRSWDIRP